MTKNIFMASLALIVSLMFCPLLAQSGDNKIVKETRDLSGFTSIRLQAVGDIVFTQSSDYSFSVEGNAEYVNKLITNLEGDKLVINYKEKRPNSKDTKKATFYISAPDLEEVNIEGVSSFYADKALSLKDVRFKMEGVGHFKIKDLKCNTLRATLSGVGGMDIHLDCREVTASVDGVGDIKLSGESDKVCIRQDGVGKVKIDDLKYKTLNNSDKLK